MEKKLIRASIDKREDYEKIKNKINVLDFSEWGKVVFEHIDKYYTLDKTALQIDIDFIIKRIQKEYPRMADTFIEYIHSLPEIVSTDNILDYITSLKKRKIGMQIGIKFAEDNPKGVESLMEKYLNYTEIEEEENVFIAPKISDLIQCISGKNIIPIYPVALAQLLGGGIPRQSHIIIFGRPDLGKTCVAINIAVGAAKQEYRVLYIDNENPPQYTILRILTRFLNRDMNIIKNNQDKAMEAALKRGYKNIIFAPMSPGTVPKIRELVRKHKPDIVIIDQVKNIKATNEGTVENLEAVCKEARNIGKEFNTLVISLTQAGQEATGKVILRMEDAFNSKTGLQGTADLMIGLGQNQELRDRGQIMLSFPKRKFWPDLKPLLCKINYSLNKVIGV